MEIIRATELDLSNEVKIALLILQIVGSLFTCFFNGVGLLAIYSYKKKTNQNIILTSLSCIEILFVLITVMFRVSLDYKIDAKLLLSMLAFQWFVWCQLVFTMYLLCIDRLICVSNPLRYKDRLTRKRTLVLILATLLISVSVSIASVFVSKTNYLSMFVVMIAANILYIVFAIITYAVAFVVVRRSTEIFGQSQDVRKKKVKKILLVPAILVLTYIAFYVLPSILMLVEVNKGKQGQYAFQIYKVFASWGFVIDPITYVLLTKHYRKCLVARIHTWRSMFGYQGEVVTYTTSDGAIQQTH